MRTVLIIALLAITSAAQHWPGTAPIQLADTSTRMNYTARIGMTTTWLFQNKSAPAVHAVALATMKAFRPRWDDPLRAASGLYVSAFEPDLCITPLSQNGYAPFDAAWTGQTAARLDVISIAVHLPNDPALIGIRFYWEGWWWAGNARIGLPSGTWGPWGDVVIR